MVGFLEVLMMGVLGLLGVLLIASFIVMPFYVIRIKNRVEDVSRQLDQLQEKMDELIAGETTNVPEK